MLAHLKHVPSAQQRSLTAVWCLLMSACPSQRRGCGSPTAQCTAVRGAVPDVVGSAAKPSCGTQRSMCQLPEGQGKAPGWVQEQSFTRPLPWNYATSVVDREMRSRPEKPKPTQVCACAATALLCAGASLTPTGGSCTASRVEV
jgi:hypothetical protein